MEHTFRNSLEGISETLRFVSQKKKKKGIIPVSAVLAGISASLLTKGLANRAQRSVTDTKAFKPPESGLV